MLLHSLWPAPRAVSLVHTPQTYTWHIAGPTRRRFHRASVEVWAWTTSPTTDRATVRRDRISERALNASEGVHIRIARLHQPHVSGANSVWLVRADKLGARPI